MVLKKTLESPLDCMEIQSVNPKGNQPWILIGSTDAWCWSSNVLATWCEEPIHWKRPWCWERLRAGRKEGDRGWDGWMASLTQWKWVWANSGRYWRMGKPGMLQSTGLQRVRHDWGLKNNKSRTSISLTPIQVLSSLLLLVCLLLIIGYAGPSLLSTDFL